MHISRLTALYMKQEMFGVSSVIKVCIVGLFPYNNFPRYC